MSQMGETHQCLPSSPRHYGDYPSPHWHRELSLSSLGTVPDEIPRVYGIPKYRTLKFRNTPQSRYQLGWWLTCNGCRTCYLR